MLIVFGGYFVGIDMTLEEIGGGYDVEAEVGSAVGDDNNLCGCCFLIGL
jgi:hypothetical protein